MVDRARAEGVRLADLIGALSLATDIGMGQPMEHALRTCVLATRLGEAAGLDQGTLAATYYVALLRYVGCTADAGEAAAFFGDELKARRAFAPIDPGSRRELAAYVQRNAGRGFAPPKRTVLVAAGLAVGRRGPRRAFAAHCEVAQRLAARLGLAPEVVVSLGHAFERWDGRGFPHGIGGEAVPVPARIVLLARDAEVFARADGPDAALAIVRERSGAAYDPELAAVFSRCGGELLGEIERSDVWEAALAAEPGEGLRVQESSLDDTCRAMADFVDLKSPFTRGHSPGVAELAEAAAWRLGMEEAEVRSVRRAALLHDLGRVGISNAIWDKPGPLTAAEWERVRLHPYLTERILARSETLAPLAPVARAHHERLDGSGYHRGCAAAQLDRPSRLLAAADALHALGEERPHRPPRNGEEAAELLRKEAGAGRLDSDCVGAVLEAAGHRSQPVPRALPAGITDREAQVLSLLARGRSNRAIAKELAISPKTVGRHVEHLYEKAGVRTRAAAALFAAEHGLVRF